ncbi:MAG: hypothetical protein K8I29_01740 [Alphaproteobacteria bacterium]|uniref:Wadjet protein JetD C-terminal domain-containing protein n=1 Tax=Candidatus Nitrobium versatile TaxID=2884831 RepID=A0A953LVJ1_9BACT|nr:hypothetical protein [Candidatus Nitrobium versatile]
MSDWSTPADIKSRVVREWERGRLLAAPLTGEALYPWRLPLKGPASAETLGTRFDAVRRWIKTLAEGAKAEGRSGYRLEFREINHRQLGRNSIPVAAWLDTEDDALALIGKRRDAARFRELADMISHAFPQVHDWLARRSLRVLEHADDWPALLGILRWIAGHPRPNVYVRQIDVPGVHSKFIERHHALLTELLDIVLPPEAIDAGAARGAAGFERRYGFRSKPVLIRFRLLGGQQTLLCLSDITVPGDEFARLSLPVKRIFITENEINFLSFPPAADGLVIFGSGYGFEALAGASWLSDTTIYYWGDIDTHGFAILDQLRSRFPQARSLLMDRDTLMAHQSLWGREDAPTRRDLPRLLGDEALLYDDLRHDRIGTAVRLEQERISFGWIQTALAAIGNSRCDD